MKVKFVGPVKDYSGYGEACRHDVAALVAGKVGVTTEIPQYTLELSDYGEIGELAVSKEDSFKDYNHIIMHVTPNVYQNYIESGKYHIGRVFWETDKLPIDFSRNLHLLQEIWTGSEWTKKAILNSGVKDVPIYIIPEAIDASVKTSDFKPYIIANKKDYKFYSIFEWTERKNPIALLTAFWQEFQDDENVSLTLKTYVDNFTPKKRAEIENYVKKAKRMIKLNKYADVYIVNRLMDRHQIYRLHKTFDCFVSAHRGEGWGIPQMEAMLMKNPIISTNLGGVHEYLTDKKDALLPNYQLIPLKENSRNQNWYTSDQNWGDVNIEDLRKAMRYCYKNRAKAKQMGLAGRRTIEANFSLEVVGKKMAKRLKEINKS